jgi:hypothetical protein
MEAASRSVNLYVNAQPALICRLGQICDKINVYAARYDIVAGYNVLQCPVRSFLSLRYDADHSMVGEELDQERFHAIIATVRYHSLEQDLQAAYDE